MSEPPPSVKRPTWDATTMVLPKAKVSGSTAVLCWLVVLLNESVMILVSGTAARAAGMVSTSSAAAARPVPASLGAVRVDRMGASWGSDVTGVTNLTPEDPAGHIRSRSEERRVG